jgi:hypothetical protein
MNNITDSALALLRQVDWKFLIYLNLSLNPIKNKGVEHICKCNFPRLERLIFQKTGATSSIFRHVAKAQWPLLK